MKKYITYEEPLQGRKFTEQQMHEVYRDLADKRIPSVFHMVSGHDPIRCIRSRYRVERRRDNEEI